MRLNYSVVAAMAVTLAGPALGQEAFKRFENTLQAPTPATGASAAQGAAGTATTPPAGYLGASVDETAELGKGVLVTGVKKGAPSELGGLKEGDIIVGLNGKPCRKLDDLDAVLAQSTIGTKLTMQVQRAGKLETKVVTLGRRPIEAEPAADPAAETTGPLSTPLAAPPATAPPATSPPATSPLATPPRTTPSIGPRPPAPGIGAADPAATAPTLRNPLNPAADAAPPSDPLAAPPRDPALTLPPPPGGDRSIADPFTPAASDPAPLDPAAEAASGRASLGIHVVSLSEETRLAYGIRSTARQGAVIVSVKPGSPADTVGLPIGGVVVMIDGQVVKNSDDLVGAISVARPGQEVELSYYQGDRLTKKTLRLAPAATRSVVSAPPRPGMVLGNPERPLLRKFEDMVESLSPGVAPAPTNSSSIFDPSRLAELHTDIKAMREQLDALDKRVKALEDKAGGNP